ncbi:sensor histidine kinase [Pedobacter sp. AW31-3R]|uniref:sensor histidine kinase n=1 Tax=Pedobacter sp. AW31-3R TaxID=3445781 RepID=UPI003F9FB07B
MNTTTFTYQYQLLTRNYRWLAHILYWILLSVFVVYKLKPIPETPSAPALLLTISVIRIGTLVLLSYHFLFFIIPLFKTSSLTVFWFCLLSTILFWYMVQIGLIKLALSAYPRINAWPQNEVSILFKTQILSFVALFCFFTALYYFMDIYDRQREIKLLAKFKTEKIALESSFLKSQVNPHFLFNTLNNIYALSLKKSAQTPVIIEKLESLLHYMLYECKAELVPLADEFTFTNSYIALEKLRHKEDSCTVTTKISGDTTDKYIAPLLLINFLENAFKHGTKTSFGKSWITMDIQLSEGSMHFNLQNSKPLQVIPGSTAVEYTGGIGLKNVRRRLQILYPGKHTLQIVNRKDRFEIDLNIRLS